MKYENPENLYRDGNEREWVLDESEIKGMERRGREWFKSHLNQYPIKVNNAEGVLLVVRGEEEAYVAWRLGLKVPYLILDNVSNIEKKVKIKDMKPVSRREYVLARKPHSVRDRFVE